MSKAGTVRAVNPKFAIPGGEIIVECTGLELNAERDFACFIGGEKCRLVAASANRLLAVVPERPAANPTLLQLISGGENGDPVEVSIGRELATELHLVANPAIDPKDDTLILTRSGSRGQRLPATLFRLEADGYLAEMPVDVINPTGIAFDRQGELYVTNRSDGEVVRIDNGEDAVVFSAALGIATGIAFDHENIMYVGDRSGTIFRVPEYGNAETFAVLEPSVSAYHIAFGPDERLYVTAPGLASFDSVYAIEPDGSVERYARGFGRPQGLAFDTDGNLYVAACYRGRHGIVKIGPGGSEIEPFLAGPSVVGLCFSRKGEMIVATGTSAYSVEMGITGTLLDRE